MPLTRREILLGTAALAAGLSAAACGPARRAPQGARKGTGGGATGEVTAALRTLVGETGRDAFQRVEVGRRYRRLAAEVLTAGGAVQRYTYDFDKPWQREGDEKKSIITSPASAPMGGLPFDRLDRYVAAAGGADTVALSVDYVGRLRVDAYVGSAWVGMKADASGPVPERKPDVVDDVRAAVAEIVAEYGTKAAVVGAFNGFVHVDANVEGSTAGLRIVRHPLMAARADISNPSAFEAEWLFDPSGFDPTQAVTRQETVAKEAGVEGKVWDWEFRRPAQNEQPAGEPLVSFGAGPDGPSTRIWLDKAGKISAVVTGSCPPGQGWCPK